MSTQHLLNAAYTAPSTGDIEPLLAELCAFTKQERATYGEYLDDDTLPRAFTAIGVDEEESNDFLGRQHRFNIWRHSRSESANLNTTLFHASRDLSKDELRDSAWYQGFMPRHHMSDAVSICSQEAGWGHVALTLISTTGKPAFDPEALHDLNSIYPQLNQALSLYKRLRGVTLERKFFETTSCSKQQAHVLLDSFSRIVQCTDDALDIIRQNDGITTEGGHLKLEDSALDQRMRTSFRQTLDAAHGRSLPKPIPVDRPSGEAPYVLDCCPWVVSDTPQKDDQRYVLVTLFSPDSKPDLRDELVQSAYGLSCAETRVVRALVNGMDLKEIAAENHITVYTVRNHLKSVFAKTGFKRQGELIGKLVSFIAE